MKEKIKEQYLLQIEKYAAEVASLKRHNNGFITLELLAFSGIIASLVGCFSLDGSTTPWLLGAVVSLLAYLAVRHFDDKNKEKMEHAAALMKVYQEETKALEGDFSAQETGDAFQDPQHPYAYDLDIFGPESLFNRICRTITSGGSRTLAQYLTRETPLSIDELEKRRELQKELADDNWRMEILALGAKASGGKKIDTEKVVNAVEQVVKVNIPTWYSSPLTLLIAYGLIIGVLAVIALATCHFISINVPLGWIVVQYLTVFTLCKQSLGQIDNHGGQLRDQFVAYSQILQLVTGRKFENVRGREIQTQLREALPSFVQLEKILKSCERRGNLLGLFVTDSLFLSDYFLVRSFRKWQHTYMAKMEEWINTVNELDAMISMSGYRHNHPEATDATVTDCQEVGLQGKGLYHPFLGEKAVKNDFCIQDSHYYIITGANMAGKSTFLRALGVNYILAMAGLPVFADHLTVSRFRLFSSMRTTDDLTHGISYFNAELLRLEQLLNYCRESYTHSKEPLRTLIILDEILKGTNSLDKLNGSRRFLEAIAHEPVSGIIATHDLELSKLETEHPDRFHNYCFEIDLGTDVTYTYLIRPGVARNQNATFLLNKILERQKF